MQKQYNELTQARWNLADARSSAWIVHLDGAQVDIVWFEAGMTSRQVRDRLVYQDGYNVNISVHRPS